MTERPTDIPKIIHYCWFGGKPLSREAKRCIRSWKKFFPDYEIRRCDETNYDIDAVPYTSQAYAAGRYAFVSDYARFDLLYRHGGIYFDTDVEVIRPFDDIVAQGPFMGFEKCLNTPGLVSGVAPGLCLGALAGMPFYKSVLDLYSNLSFLRPDGKPDIVTVVHHVTRLMCRHGLVCENRRQQVDGITVYPYEYFCPADFFTNSIEITPLTHSIHWYSGSWRTTRDRIRDALNNLLGDRFFGLLKRVVRRRK